MSYVKNQQRMTKNAKLRQILEFISVKKKREREREREKEKFNCYY